MAGKLDNYAIGSAGVNNTKSPIHLEDTELVSCQNAEPNLENREGGLRKRGGFEVLNSTALNGGATIHGVVNLPLLTTFTYTMFASTLDPAGSTTWYTSTDGTTWTAVTTPAQAATWNRNAFPTILYHNTRIANLKNTLLYPGNDYLIYPVASFTEPSLRAYIDGATDVELTRFNIGPDGTPITTAPYALTDMVVNNGKLYFGIYELSGGNNGGRVMSMDLSTGIIKQIGNHFGGGSLAAASAIPWALCFYRGELYCGLHGVGGASVGKVYRINPDAGSTWTADVTNLQGYPISLCVYKGDLYAGLQGDNAETALVVRRAAGTGVWGTSDTGTGTTTGVKYYTALTVHGTTSKLLAVYHHTNDDLLNVRSFDGTTWATDATISASFSPTGVTDFGGQLPGQIAILPATGDAYLIVEATPAAGTNGFIMKRTAGGVWSIATQGKNLGKYLCTGLVRS